jgi:hypothetical protein
MTMIYKKQLLMKSNQKGVIRAMLNTALG